MTQATGRRPHILHIIECLDGGAAARRCCAVAESLGDGLRHAVVTAEASALGPAPFENVHNFPKLTGVPVLGKLQKIARALMQYDLVCTWDYWAMNAVMAHTAFSQAFTLPPLVHHELEGTPRTRKADWYRRIALGKSAALVVPDERLEEAALVGWQQPFGRVRLIREGVDLAQWEEKPPTDMLGGLLKRKGEFWLGCVTAYDAGECLDELLMAAASFYDDWHLVLLDAPVASRDFSAQRAAIRARAKELGVAHRIHVPGALDANGRAIGLFDIALVQANAPLGSLTAVRAMASGIPILADTSGHAAHLLPETDIHLGADFRAADSIGDALAAVIRDFRRLKTLGEQMRAHARRYHSAKSMLDSHRRLYASVMGREITG